MKKPLIRTWHREAYKEGRINEIPDYVLRAIKEEEEKKKDVEDKDSIRKTTKTL